MSALARIPTMMRAARTDRGQAWAIFSQALNRLVADPADDAQAAVLRTAFYWHSLQQRGRPPEPEDYARLEARIGRELPPVIGPEAMARLVETIRSLQATAALFALPVLVPANAR